MRRLATRGVRVALAGALSVFLCLITASVAEAQATEWKATNEHGVSVRSKAWGGAGRMWGFWGELRGKNDNPPYGLRPYGPNGKRPQGSYRATCVWLADSVWAATPKRRDNRLLCTVLLAIDDPQGSTLVAEGLVRKPLYHSGVFDGLFERASTPGANRPPRKLAITGGTGVYTRMSGYIDVSQQVITSVGTATVTYGLLSVVEVA